MSHADLLQLAGRKVLVTGGTRGIGAAIVEAFLNAGTHVVATGTNAEQVGQLNQQVAGSKLTYEVVDFTEEASTNAFVSALPDHGFDVVVNNAGTNRIGRIQETNPADYDFLMQINLRAPYLINRAVVGGMKARGWGRIVNIASIWSVITKPGRSIYTTTKFGLVGMTKTMAVELASSNVLVNAVSPGFTLTELTRSTLSSEDFERLAGQVPAARFAEPSEIAKAVLFLSSQMNSYIVGQNIVVDGGFVCV